MADFGLVTRAGQNLTDHLSRKYGLSLADYQRLLEKQGGRCAACTTLPPVGRRLHVDQDHHTGEVRGLLCHGCNVALGLMEEHPELILRLAEYAARAAELREIARRHPRSVLGVPAHFKQHPLIRVFERVPDKTAAAQNILAAVRSWPRAAPQQDLPLEDVS